jgi:hypothetical protein
MILMAGWQSGHAAACKAVNGGSIPPSASIFCLNGKSEKSSSDVRMTSLMLVDSYYHTK